jgi:hypothetical protein
MDGGTGDDIMCGDGGTDGMTAGDTDAGADILWGADAADTITCGNTSTYWTAVSNPVGCGTNYVVSRPAQCP